MIREVEGKTTFQFSLSEEGYAMDCVKTTLLAVSLILPAALFTSQLRADPGNDAIWKMRYYYERTLDDCGVGRPLDQCSGLRIRGTDSMKWFEPWDPSPASVASGGVSMSFIRKDISYSDLGLRKNNGFVFKPNDFIADDETKVNTLCFYPIDAWTDFRDNAGCTDNRNTTDHIERTCQDAGITTSERWLANYRKLGNNHQKQCGFDIRSREDDALSFWQGVLARRLIQDDRDAIETQTEIRVPTWKNDADAQLPILAFIYTPTDRTAAVEGLEYARDDQRRYFGVTGKWKPVIRVDLPRSTNEQAVFTYYPADQTVPSPKVDNDCTSYIENADWQRRADPNIEGEPWSLVVKPSACGRAMTKEQQSAAYAELYAKYGSSPNWSPDNGSMWQQFVCHLEWSGNVNGNWVYTRNKETWNLEPARPRVGDWSQVFNEGCNPH